MSGQDSKNSQTQNTAQLITEGVVLLKGGVIPQTNNVDSSQRPSAPASQKPSAKK
jgi:hypothetical protein